MDFAGEFLYCLLVLAAPYLLLRGVFWVFRIRRPGLAALLAICISFPLVPFHPYALLAALLPFALGYLTGRSTRVSLDPTDVFSPRVRVTDAEYSQRADQFSRLMSSRLGMTFFESPYLHWTEKMTAWFWMLEHGLYRYAPVTALLVSPFYLFVWSAASMGYEECLLLLLLLSLPYGNAIGTLAKYVRGYRDR